MSSEGVNFTDLIAYFHDYYAVMDDGDVKQHLEPPAAQVSESDIIALDYVVTTVVEAFGACTKDSTDQIHKIKFLSGTLTTSPECIERTAALKYQPQHIKELSAAGKAVAIGDKLIAALRKTTQLGDPNAGAPPNTEELRSKYKKYAKKADMHTLKGDMYEAMVKEVKDELLVAIERLVQESASNLDNIKAKL